MAPHTVVILGAGFGGLPIAHWLMKHQVPTNKDLKVVLVSPTSDFFWNIASPRAVLPKTLSDDKVFYPITANFSKYPQKNQFEFVIGKAEGLDSVTQTVAVAEISSGAHRNIHYDTLIIATGSAAKASMPWKNVGTTQDTKQALEKLRKEIAAAKHIVVAGGGQTGSELAGELGSEYSAKGLKQITFVIDDHLPLNPDARNDVRQAVASRLESFKVRIVRSTRATAAAEKGNKTVLELTSRDGKKQETLEADLYLPTVGVVPNSDFAPSSMLAADGRFKQTTSLRVEGYDNIFVLGDVGNLQTATAKHASDQTAHLVKVLGPYLSGQKTSAEPVFKVDNSPMFAVTLGKSHGIGQMGTWKLWSWLVAMVKSKHMGTNQAADAAAGTKM